MPEPYIYSGLTEPQQPQPQQPAEPPKPPVQYRFLIVKLVFALLFVTGAFRLIQIQLLENGKYRQAARRQYEQKLVLPAKRGSIYDRNGNVLASNTMTYSFAADPKLVGDDARVVANLFARVFGKPSSFYMEKFDGDGDGKPERRFVWLERNVLPDAAKRIDVKKLQGVTMLEVPQRIYHYENIACSPIGRVDVDNRGISGLELVFDEYLRGKDGHVVLQRDGRGKTRASVDYPRVEPVDGDDLVLTIDISAQTILEEELRKGVIQNKAEGGLAVMVNPVTGEVIAVAGVGSYDQNAPDHRGDRVRAVTDIFEPGSVFKLVTATAALEYNTAAPDKLFNAEHGVYQVALPRGKFRKITDTHEYGMLTFQQAMEVSSNIVLAKIGATLGAERFYRQARDFGFGIVTGLEFPGEVRGVLKKPAQWSGTSLHSMSYGYEVNVTPVQITMAYAAVANKGLLMQPYIMRSLRASGGAVVEQTEPQTIRRVMSPETAQRLTQMFEGVIVRGTGKDAKLDAVRVAGKTGTSRRNIDGKYVEGYTASFVGFFPVDAPALVCLVMMDNPRGKSYYGGNTSGPVFRELAKRMTNTLPQYPLAKADTVRKDVWVAVPDIRNMPADRARMLLGERGLVADSIGHGSFVLRHEPEAGANVEPGSHVRMVLGDPVERTAKNMVVVPDLRGMSLRRAMNRLVLEKLKASVEGSGMVMTQRPAAGEQVPAGTTVRLVCRPKNFAGR